MSAVTDIKISTALEMGLEIVGQPTEEYSDNIKYLFYKFIKCGHTQNIDSNLVRKGLFKCRACEQNKLEKAAEDKGLILLERAHKGTPALYRFKECNHEQRIGYDAVYRGFFKCRTCYYDNNTPEDKYKREAEKQCLEFIRKTENGHATYRKLSCGHTFDYQITAVRNSNKGGYGINCQVCKEQEFIELINSFGIELLSKVKDKITYKRICGHTYKQTLTSLKSAGVVECAECKKQDTFDRAFDNGLTVLDVDKVNSVGSGVYKFNNCSHTVNLERRDILSDEPISCKICNNEKFQMKLHELDISFIEFNERDKRKFTGTFNTCGHTKLFTKGDLFRRDKKRLDCPVCISEKHIREANEVGLELIGKANNNDPNYRSFKMPCCGSLQDLELTHVRNKSFNCRTCNTNRYSKESNLYLFEIDHEDMSWLKLGIALDIDKRCAQYGLPEESKVELLYSVKFENGYDSLLSEKRIHTIMKPFRLDSEKMKLYHRKSGFTECYPVSMKKELLSIMKGLSNE